MREKPNLMQEVHLDALLPSEMAVKAEALGVLKAGQPFDRMFCLSVLAGAFIALGAVLSTVAVVGANGVLPFGVVRLLAGFVFSLGLILVVVGGAELFTGNNLIVMAWASGKVSVASLFRNWVIVFFGNFIGAVGTAILVFASGHYSFGEGAIGAAALSIADAKLKLEFGPALVLGLLCNTLVCLAVWLTYSARSTVDRIFSIIPPITAFVAAGFEHSIANMYFVPFALMVQKFAPESFWQMSGQDPSAYSGLSWSAFIFSNLVPVTLGNIIGGAGLVGAVYWFVYLRSRKTV
jgi:formate transporter